MRRKGLNCVNKMMLEYVRDVCIDVSVCVWLFFQGSGCVLWVCESVFRSHRIYEYRIIVSVSDATTEWRVGDLWVRGPFGVRGFCVRPLTLKKGQYARARCSTSTTESIIYMSESVSSFCVYVRLVFAMKKRSDVVVYEKNGLM